MLCISMSLVYKEITLWQTPLHNAQDNVKLDPGLAYWYNVLSLLIFKGNDAVGLRFNITFCMVQYYCPSGTLTRLCHFLVIALRMQSLFYQYLFQGHVVQCYDHKRMSVNIRTQHTHTHIYIFMVIQSF